jgi:hypothetical protein
MDCTNDATVVDRGAQARNEEVIAPCHVRLIQASALLWLSLQPLTATTRPAVTGTRGFTVFGK